MAYEDAIYTRNSHYSFEIKNNRLRIFPQHTSGSPKKFWVNFTIQEDPWDEESDRTVGVDGVNNLNTIPFGNIPFENINSIGKQWIRRFALALAKEMLGQVRGKFGNSIPIPGDNVSLNATDLLSQAKEEQEKLREELKTVLDELTYSKLAAMESDIANAVTETTKNVPAGIFVG
jgi:transcription termination factor NusB